jgi:hypothetical protein
VAEVVPLARGIYALIVPGQLRGFLLCMKRSQSSREERELSPIITRIKSSDIFLIKKKNKVVSLPFLFPVFPARPTHVEGKHEHEKPHYLCRRDTPHAGCLPYLPQYSAPTCPYSFPPASSENTIGPDWMVTRSLKCNCQYSSPSDERFFFLNRSLGTLLRSVVNVQFFVTTPREC